MNYLKYILLFSFLLIGLNLFAQKDSIKCGKLEVKVIDEMTKKPIEYAVVTIEKNSFKKKKYSDNNGEVVFDSLPIGTYSITTNYSGYAKTILEGLILKSDTITKRTISIYKKSTILSDIPQPKPLIKPDEPTQQYLNNKQIMRMPY